MVGCQVQEYSCGKARAFQPSGPFLREILQLEAADFKNSRFSLAASGQKFEKRGGDITGLYVGNTGTGKDMGGKLSGCCLAVCPGNAQESSGPKGCCQGQFPYYVYFMCFEQCRHGASRRNSRACHSQIKARNICFRKMIFSHCLYLVLLAPGSEILFPIFWFQPVAASYYGTPAVKVSCSRSSCFSSSEDCDLFSL